MKSVDHNELEIMDSWMETIAEAILYFLREITGMPCIRH